MAASRALTWARLRRRPDLRARSLIEALVVTTAFLCLLAFFRGYADGTAGGSDSYGYVSEAVRLSHGHFYQAEHVLSPFGLPENSTITHPLGYAPQGAAGTIPTYPFGYPVLLAIALEAAGFSGVFWVTPVLGAGMVILTYFLGRSYLGYVGGVLAATLTLALPNFLMFAAQPMSDVPAAFCATLALCALLRQRQHPINDVVLAVAEGLGIWIRPNLALLVIPALAWLLWRRDFSRVVRFAICLAPFVFVEAAVNTHLYGEPWTTGYGDPPFTHSLTDALQRGGRYLTRLNTQQAGVGLILVAFGLVFGKLFGNIRVLLIGLAGLLLVFFSFYSVDDAWWYGRFLLPGLAPVAIIEASGIVRLFELPTRRWISVPCLVAGVALFLWPTIGFDRANSVFDIGRGDVKYQNAAHFVRQSVGGKSLVLAMQHSGSLRLYGGIDTMRYDLAPVPELLGVLEHVTDAGGSVYLVGEDWEIQRIRDSNRAVLLAGAQDLGSVEPSHVTLFRLNVLEPKGATVPNPLDATFGDQIALRGFDLSPRRPRPGDGLTVTLYWEAPRKPDNNYTVFIHVVGSDGKIISQSDSYPVDGRYPTTTWTPGYTIKDVHRLTVPPNTPIQNVHVIAGMYRVETMRRLQPHGRSVAAGADYVELGTFSVRRSP